MLGIADLKEFGRILFVPLKDATQVVFQLHNLPPFPIGCHIHEFGDERLGCESLGPHYNPYHQKHGSFDRHGLYHHAGDLLNNVQGDSHGRFFVDYVDPLLVNVEDLFGRSIVLHAGKDDEGKDRDNPNDPESGTTGHSGKRIACAIIGRTNNLSPEPIFLYQHPVTQERARKKILGQE